ncbi:hypothetical protein M514_10040 [Trichuris suis]|uniref:Uncharacterized protein n=1 Tax=Trichuris suis TaxID=68888 RepID=A0A085LVV2_9BILA|nr:hypothetical protein M513_10040 [Trichuris suis]KFD68880.1 hypothetical protein M514_10040 [Trichuris suis]
MKVWHFKCQRMMQLFKREPTEEGEVEEFAFPSPDKASQCLGTRRHKECGPKSFSCLKNN